MAYQDVTDIILLIRYIAGETAMVYRTIKYRRSTTGQGDSCRHADHL